MKKIAVLFILSSTLLLAGCQIAPGSHIDTSGKKVVHSQENKQSELDIHVYPVTPALIAQLRKTWLLPRAMQS